MSEFVMNLFLSIVFADSHSRCLPSLYVCLFIAFEELLVGIFEG